MDLETIKKLLAESAGADEAAKVVESLSTWKTGVEKAADAATKLKVEEAVNESRVKLETEYLTKLDASKAEADKKIREEISKYEIALAKKVKSVLETAVAKHGEQLVEVAKEQAVAKGSKLLKEVATLVASAASEKQVDESAVKETELLKAEVETLKKQLEESKKGMMEATARKNVAEQNLKTLKESLDTTMSVTVEETEKPKAKPAAETHEDSKPLDEQVVAESAAKVAPGMQRMRELAGIGKVKK